MQAGGEGDRAERVVRGHRGVIGLGHAGDQARFRDAAGVAQVGLQDGGGFLLEYFAKTPFGEDAFAGGDREDAFRGRSRP